MSATTPQTEVYLATGRRKTSSARVRLFPNGAGKLIVNGKPLEKYCFHEPLSKVAVSPFATVEQAGSFDADIRVTGGGPNSQAGAIRHALARALEKFNPEWRVALKRAGHLKRDPRQKERKKPGQPGARKRFQFSKR